MMPLRRTVPVLLPLVTLVTLALHAAGAQEGAAPASRRWEPLVLIGGPAEDRLRLHQLDGEASTAGWLVRTPSALTPVTQSGPSVAVPGACAVHASVVPAHASAYWNSSVPFARNDGGVWAGRGATVAAAGGFRLRCGRVTAWVVPEVWHARNDAFYVLPSHNALLSDFASPFHSVAQTSADLPSRLGTKPLTAFAPGQSSIAVDLGHVTLGGATESEWWGPGIRNALVLSNNAAGIPRWFLGTTRPVPTRLGALSARLFAGYLTESRFFHRFERGVARPLSGVVITLATAADSNLSLGAARAVYRRRTSTVFPAYALDALTYWNLRSPDDSADQVSSLFARWVFPGSGFETYGEWARSVLPGSLTQLLTAPHAGQGFTLGLQWLSHARDTATPWRWRLQAEITNLEQVRPSRTESPASFYSSPVVPHGYTQRGRVIGAAIGPGAQSQWLALDRVGARTMFGAFLGRIRWHHDEFFPRPSGLSFYAHDVSVYGGMRGSHRTQVVEYTGELQLEQRMNYLFQHANFGFGDDRTFDVRNVSLKLTVTPRR